MKSTDTNLLIYSRMSASEKSATTSPSSQSTVAVDNLSTEMLSSSQETQQIATEVEYARELMKRLNVFRQSSLHTDVVLCVSGKEFPCHRIILAASSEVFNAMFSSSLKETQEGRVELHGTSENILKRLLDYVYTGHIDVDSESVQDLLVAASLYQFPAVVSSCCRYLVSSLDLSNCLRIEEFARLHTCEAVERDARHYINENFEQIMMESEEFGELTIDRLESYLSSNELDVHSEIVVFDAVVRWINFDPVQRTSESCRLLQHVRFRFIDDVDFLKERIQSHTLIASCPTCSALVDNAIKLIYTSEDKRDSSKQLDAVSGASSAPAKQTKESMSSILGNLTTCDISEALGKSTESETSTKLYYDRRPSTVAREVLVVVGGMGQNMELLQTVEAYNPRKKRWTSLPDLPVAISNFSTTVTENDIFVIGGEASGQITSNVWQFISKKRCWIRGPSLIAPRSCHTSAVFESFLYVIGGIKELASAASQTGNDNLTTDERRSARTVECLNLSCDNPTWSVVIPDIPFPRRNSTIIRFDSNLVEIGGTTNNASSKMMTIYQCSKDKPWISQLEEHYVLESEIEHAKFQYINGHFYIIWEDTRKVMSLNPSRRTLKKVSDTLQKHTSGGATLLEGFLYIAGGLNEQRPSKVVEKYDHNANKWILTDDMRVERVKFGCVTISIS